MDIIYIIIPIVISIFAVIISYIIAYLASKDIRHQALLNIHKEFRSPEMLSALDGVWEFYYDFKDKHLNLQKNPIKFNESLKEEYKTRHKKERKQLGLDTKNSLNYKRRYITHFYIYLASLHKHEILPEEMMFDWWTSSNFRIFQDILIPLQEAASEICDPEHQENTPEELKFTLEPLLRLQYDSIQYHKKNKKKQTFRYNDYQAKINSHYKQ